VRMQRHPERRISIPRCIVFPQALDLPKTWFLVYCALRVLDSCRANRLHVDAEKRRKIGKKRGIVQVYSYDDDEKALSSVDAV
jgi:hypothetical protein